MNLLALKASKSFCESLLVAGESCIGLAPGGGRVLEVLGVGDCTVPAAATFTLPDGAEEGKMEGPEPCVCVVIGLSNKPVLVLLLLA